MTDGVWSAKDVEAAMMQWPGKRGIDIPADIFDTIAPIAHGISKQVWGTNAEPHHLQYLHDNGLHEPEQIHQAFGAMVHPHANNVTVGEYEHYSKALKLFQEHQQ